MKRAPYMLALWLVVVWQTGLAAPMARSPSKSSLTQSYSLAFKDADIKQAIEEVLGQDLGLPYTIDPAVTGVFSFRIEQRLTKAQLLEAFEAALSANGVALVRQGDTVSVLPLAKAKTTTSIRPAASGLSGAGYEVVATPLAHALASEVAKALETMSGKDVVLYSSDKLGLIILGGSGRDLKTPLETIKLLDQSAAAGRRVHWMELAQSSATSVADEVDRLLQSTSAGGASIVPVSRLNGVMLTARSPETLALLIDWVRKLDAPARDGASTLWVYHPKNTSAEALATTLSAVLGAPRTDDPQTTTTKGAAAAGGAPADNAGAHPAPKATAAGPDQGMRIGVDKASNALIIYAPALERSQVQKILEEIDRRPAQLFIEASILEVTLNKDLEAGVDWTALADGKHLGVSNLTGLSTAVAAKAPGFALTYLDGNIQAAINALQSRTNVQVISAPKIMALDNRTAKMQVGDQVPIVTQSAQGTLTSTAAVINSVEYRNTGIILNVTPRIAGEDRIVMDISQEVSSVAKTVTSGIDSPTIQQRKFESTLVLRNGGLVALGGLISSSDTNTQTGMPILMDVPILGALFRERTISHGRTELIVLLSAKIVRDDADADKILVDFSSKLKEVKDRHLDPLVR